MGARKSHKKQHYVPASYLRAWVDPDRPERHTAYVWVFPKHGGEGRRRAPKNLFTETDFYTVPDAHGGRDLTLEHALASLESDFALVVDRLKRDPTTELKAKDRSTLDLMVATMHARTVSQADHWRSEWGRVDEIMTKMRDAAARMSPTARKRLARPHELSGDIDNAISQDEVREILRSPQQHLMLPQIAAMVPAIRSMDMVLLHTDDPLGFITSDAPIFIGDPELEPGGLFGVRLMSPTVELYLPVAPAHCLVMQRTGMSGIHYADRTIVDDINRRTRYSCFESFVVRRNETDPYWFAETPRD